MRATLGGKGAGLAEMARLGLDVPAGFTLSTELCAIYTDAQKKGLDASVWEEVQMGVRFVEGAMGRTFFSSHKPCSGLPLLLSVRSGAAASMPGMMDTILNVGLNDEVVEALCADTAAATTAERRFVRDAFRRLLDMFGDVVLRIPREAFECELADLKRSKEVQSDTDLSDADLKELCAAYKRVYAKHSVEFPSDPEVQLRMAIEAVLASWNNPRAIKYRAINRECADLKGTAVNVQAMVFGNRDERSCSGVCFTRDPRSGLNAPLAEYLRNAQGEDVVSGTRTPEGIDQLEADFPACYAKLREWLRILEAHYKDMMDVEFTVESDRLWILQCRAGKRTGLAAVRIATDMVDDGLISAPRALLLVQMRHLEQLLRPRFVGPYRREDVVATGLPASPGAAVGRIVFSAEDAEGHRMRGEDCILVRVETSAEDVGGMNAAKGILTARGGMTSHAAVVARGWGKPCVVGCSEMHIHERQKTVTFGKIASPRAVFREHEVISLDGDSGNVIRGDLELTTPGETSEDPVITRIMRWADETRTMKVLANADTPADVRLARAKGAEGIGLVRTEHMFFASPNRLQAMRGMVLAEDDATRKIACEKMLPFQCTDFEGIFEAMAGLPVCVRLLDPPLHEFLPPRHSQELERVAANIAAESPTESVADILARAERLRESNPMLGMRGCRLGVLYPEVTRMQVRAIYRAAKACIVRGMKVRPQIMVPLVAIAEEFRHQLSIVRAVHAEVFGEALSPDVPACEVGAMVETPRAALISDDLVRAGAQFLSFGTNDLTQMSFGMSRDDVAPILRAYCANGIMTDDPFETIDRRGVGRLIESCVRAARSQSSAPKCVLGVCGEHGGEAHSIAYFASEGVRLDYVSCSPHRVMAARLAAAQAAARNLVA